MEDSIPIPKNPHILKPKTIEVEELGNAVIDARQRAITAHKTVSSWKKSQIFYKLGGWGSLFEEYITQPLKPSIQAKEKELEMEHNPSTNSLDKIADSIKQPLCPSASPEMGNTIVFGVVEGNLETPRIAYLTESQPVTDEILALSDPVKPTEVFRMASYCQVSACQHFDGANCRLAKRIVEDLPTVVDILPACKIRPSCRWWQQEGKAACFRCPQMVTEDYNSSTILQKVADPRS